MIAKEIRELSNVSSTAGRQITERMAEVTGIMKTTFHAANEAAVQERQALEHSGRAVQDVLAHVHELSTHAQTMFDRGNAIRENIESLIVTLQFQDRVSQMISVVADDIGRMHGCGVGGDDALCAPDAWLESLEADLHDGRAARRSPRKRHWRQRQHQQRPGGRRPHLFLTELESPTMAKTILIVDDSSSLRTVVKMALTRAGYEVIEAGDGKEALGALEKAGKVHLIVSDVNMPNMDGITFVTQLKQNPKHKFTPVIMLTTESQDAKVQQAKVAGARAWLVKPFNPPQLIDAVAKLILP